MIIGILQNSWAIHEDTYTLIKHSSDINQLAFSMTMTGLVLPACLPPSGFAEYYHITGMKKRLGFI